MTIQDVLEELSALRAENKHLNNIIDEDIAQLFNAVTSNSNLIEENSKQITGMQSIVEGHDNEIMELTSDVKRNTNSIENNKQLQDEVNSNFEVEIINVEKEHINILHEIISLQQSYISTSLQLTLFAGL